MSPDAGSQSLAALSDTFAALVAGAAPSLVSLQSRRMRASGFIWRPGLIVTAEEMLPEDEELRAVLPGGETLPATMVGRDPSTALAVLKIDRAEAPALELTAPSVLPGALTLALGAQDGAPLAALGVVALASGPWRSLRGGDIAARIELDMRLRAGAIGGVALDARGQAFGMLVEGPRRRTLVIPTATIERIAPVLRDKGRIARGYLGLGLQSVAVDGGGAGAMVMNLDRDGPGAAAGVRQGDIILAVDGAPVRDVRAMTRGLGHDSVGRSMRLALRRGGEAIEVALVIAERPA